jgi:hypothetical protein
MSFMNHRFSSKARLGTSPLSDEELRTYAPSIFAEDKHISRSVRYTYIPTSEVVAGMRDNGFLPMFAKQGKSRVPGKADFTKHLIRFRYQGEGPAMRKIGEVFPEVVLINSHDGTSAYKVVAGLMRLVCLNGMIVTDQEFAKVTVPHKGNIMDQVIEGSYTVLSESRMAIERAEEWAGIRLAPSEQMLMAEEARRIRLGDPATQEVDSPIKAEQFLRVRRHEDAPNDLWTVTNRIQENAIRGGLTGLGRDGNNRPRRVSTREIHGIDQDVRVNEMLWRLADGMAKLKGQAA